MFQKYPTNEETLNAIYLFIGHKLLSLKKKVLLKFLNIVMNYDADALRCVEMSS